MSFLVILKLQALHCIVLIMSIFHFKIMLITKAMPPCRITLWRLTIFIITLMFAFAVWWIVVKIWIFIRINIILHYLRLHYYLWKFNRLIRHFIIILYYLRLRYYLWKFNRLRIQTHDFLWLDDGRLLSLHFLKLFSNVLLDHFRRVKKCLEIFISNCLAYFAIPPSSQMVVCCAEF